MMVKVFVYAYAQGLRSSRQIERALYDDVAMRWLAGNQQPDHCRISEFRRRHHDALGNILVETVRLGRQAGLVGGHDIAVDGTKFKANASKHAAMSYGYMVDEERRLREAIERDLLEMEATDRREDQAYGKRSGWTLEGDLAHKQRRLARIEEAMAALEERARAKAQAEADAKAAKEGTTPQIIDPAKVTVDPTSQYNFTDPESRIMRTADKAFIQGYNGQAAVDAVEQFVVAAELTIQSNDYGSLVPVVEQACANLDEMVPAVLADAGYFSEDNVSSLCAMGIQALIPPNRIPHAQWREQPEAHGAPPADATVREAMRHMLRTPEGRARYQRRQETVEPMFGHVKQVQGQRQELLRGYAKARSMWRFQCAVFNLKKLVRAVLSAGGGMRAQTAGVTA